MKKSIILMFFMLFQSVCFSEEIKLAWKFSSDEQIDGFRCYQKTAYQDDYYNFDIPVKNNKYPAGDIPPEVRELTIDIPGEPSKVLKYQWVCRAFKGDEQSENSNEVAYKVVNTVPPVPVNLTGFYDDDKQIINLSWEQPADNHIVYRWEIYYRSKDDTEYSNLGIVNYGQELELSTPFNVVPDGQSKIVFFTVVAFRRSGVFSANSDEYAIVVDRQGIPAVENLIIDIDIPVE